MKEYPNFNCRSTLSFHFFSIEKTLNFSHLKKCPSLSQLKENLPIFSTWRKTSQLFSLEGLPFLFIFFQLKKNLPTLANLKEHSSLSSFPIEIWRKTSQFFSLEEKSSNFSHLKSNVSTFPSWRSTLLLSIPSWRKTSQLFLLEGLSFFFHLFSIKEKM